MRIDIFWGGQSLPDNVNALRKCIIKNKTKRNEKRNLASKPIDMEPIYNEISQTQRATQIQ